MPQPATVHYHDPASPLDRPFPFVPECGARLWKDDAQTEQVTTDPQLVTCPGCLAALGG